MIAPPSFTQTVSKEAYIEARLLAAKQKGILRYTLPMIVLSAALIVFGVRALFIAVQGMWLSYYVTGAVTVMVGLGILALWCTVLPNRIRRIADKDYAIYESLFADSTVRFTADQLTVKGGLFRRTVDYARTHVCVESSSQFVIITDDGHVIVLVKAAMTNEQETTAFLRDVFARWYKRKG